MTIWRRADGAVRAPWHVAVFGVTIVGSAIVVGGLGFAVIAPTPLVGWAREARVPLDQLATLGSILLATWLSPRYVGRAGRAWADAALDRQAWRPTSLVVATLLGSAVVAVPTGLMLLTGQVQIVTAQAADSWFTTAWAAFALMAPAALSEELLFRGFAFTAMRDAVGAARAIAITSALFGLAHLYNPEPTVLSTLAVAAAGLFLAMVRVATGSLAAAWLAHLAINFAQAVFFHAPVSGIALQTPGYRLVSTGPEWLTGGAWGPEGGLAVVVAMLAASFVLSKWTGNSTQSTVTATTGT